MLSDWRNKWIIIIIIIWPLNLKSCALFAQCSSLLLRLWISNWPRVKKYIVFKFVEMSCFNQHPCSWTWIRFHLYTEGRSHLFNVSPDKMILAVLELWLSPLQRVLKWYIFNIYLVYQPRSHPKRRGPSFSNIFWPPYLCRLMGLICSNSPLTLGILLFHTDGWTDGQTDIV